MYFLSGLPCAPLYAMNQSSLRFPDTERSLFGRSSKNYLRAPLRRIQSRNYDVLKFQGMQIMHSMAMSSMMMQFELPPLECLFKEKCHPEYESVRDECDMWTLSLFDPPLVSNDPQHVSYLGGLYPLFTCLFHPSTPSRYRLVLLTKLNNWFFIFDDMLEKADSHTIIELIHCLESTLKSVLTKSSLIEIEKLMWCPFPIESSHKDVGTTPGAERAFEFMDRLKHEVWKELCDDMTPSFRVRFAAGLLSSLNAMHHHAHMCQKRKLQNVDEGWNPKLDDLMEIRVHDSFAKPLIGVVMEYALEIDMQDIVRHRLVGATDLHEKVERLKHVAACHTIWTNDLLSLRKEFFKGECLSIVGLLLKQRGVDPKVMDTKGAKKVQEVIKEVWGMIKEQERIGWRLLEDIKKGRPSFDQHAHEELVMYCEELCRAMAGNMYWSTLTARYNGSHPLPWNTPTTLSIPYHITSATLDFLH